MSKRSTDIFQRTRFYEVVLTSYPWRWVFAYLSACCYQANLDQMLSVMFDFCVRKGTVENKPAFFIPVWHLGSRWKKKCEKDLLSVEHQAINSLRIGCNNVGCSNILTTKMQNKMIILRKTSASLCIEYSNLPSMAVQAIVLLS